MAVYNFGSINIDYVYRVPHLVRPGETLSSRSLDTLLGGKGANQSIALARAGAAVVHLGRIGAADTWARDALAEAGVDVTSVETIEGPSGHALIQVDDDGENCIVLHGGANRGFDRDWLATELDTAGQGDWLLVQNECDAVEDALALAASRSVAIACNPAPMAPEVRNWPLEHCRLLVLNEVEALDLAEVDDIREAERRLAARYPDTALAITLGGAGARLIEGAEVHECGVPEVDVVDTTGAGDTFTGYLVAALLGGETGAIALRRACAASALSVTVAGAAGSIPEAPAVERLLADWA